MTSVYAMRTKYTDFDCTFVGLLRERGKFIDKLKQVPQTPRPTSETDAVGTLLDICVQRNLPIAR